MPNKQPPPSLEEYVDAVRPPAECAAYHGGDKFYPAGQKLYAVRCLECGVFYASGTPQDAPTEHRPLRGHLAAVRTLEALRYTYHGGEMWKPPIGERPPRVLIVTNRNGAAWGRGADVVAPGVSLTGFGYDLIYVDSGVVCPPEWVEHLSSRLYPAGALVYGRVKD